MDLSSDMNEDEELAAAGATGAAVSVCLVLGLTWVFFPKAPALWWVMKKTGTDKYFYRVRDSVKRLECCCGLLRSVPIEDHGKVVISNLSLTVSGSTLTEVAAQFGALVDAVDILANGIAVVHFVRQKDADAALKQLDGMTVRPATRPIAAKPLMPKKKTATTDKGSIMLGPMSTEPLPLELTNDAYRDDIESKPDEHNLMEETMPPRYLHVHTKEPFPPDDLKTNVVIVDVDMASAAGVKNDRAEGTYFRPAQTAATPPPNDGLFSMVSNLRRSGGGARLRPGVYVKRDGKVEQAPAGCLDNRSILLAPFISAGESAAETATFGGASAHADLTAVAELLPDGCRGDGSEPDLPPAFFGRRGSTIGPIRSDELNDELDGDVVILSRPVTTAAGSNLDSVYAGDAVAAGGSSGCLSCCGFGGAVGRRGHHTICALRFKSGSESNMKPGIYEPTTLGEIVALPEGHQNPALRGRAVLLLNVGADSGDSLDEELSNELPGQFFGRRGSLHTNLDLPPAFFGSRKTWQGTTMTLIAPDDIEDDFLVIAVDAQGCADGNRPRIHAEMLPRATGIKLGLTPGRCHARQGEQFKFVEVEAGRLTNKIIILGDASKLTEDTTTETNVDHAMQAAAGHRESLPDGAASFGGLLANRLLVLANGNDGAMGESVADGEAPFSTPQARMGQPSLSEGVSQKPEVLWNDADTLELPPTFFGRRGSTITAIRPGSLRDNVIVIAKGPSKGMLLGEMLTSDQAPGMVAGIYARNKHGKLARVPNRRLIQKKILINDTGASNTDPDSTAVATSAVAQGADGRVGVARSTDLVELPPAFFGRRGSMIAPIQPDELESDVVVLDLDLDDGAAAGVRPRRVTAACNPPGTAGLAPGPYAIRAGELVPVTSKEMANLSVVMTANLDTRQLAGETNDMDDDDDELGFQFFGRRGGSVHTNLEVNPSLFGSKYAWTKASALTAIQADYYGGSDSDDGGDSGSSVVPAVIASPVMANKALVIGQRVRVQGLSLSGCNIMGHGRTKYVGPARHVASVPGRSGPEQPSAIVVGVEMDDAVTDVDAVPGNRQKKRGRGSKRNKGATADDDHNGWFGGVAYFSCRLGHGVLMDLSYFDTAERSKHAIRRADTTFQPMANATGAHGQAADAELVSARGVQIQTGPRGRATQLAQPARPLNMLEEVVVLDNARIDLEASDGGERVFQALRFRAASGTGYWPGFYSREMGSIRPINASHLGEPIVVAVGTMIKVPAMFSPGDLPTTFFQQRPKIKKHGTIDSGDSSTALGVKITKAASVYDGFENGISGHLAATTPLARNAAPIVCDVDDHTGLAGLGTNRADAASHGVRGGRAKIQKAPSVYGFQDDASADNVTDAGANADASAPTTTKIQKAPSVYIGFADGNDAHDTTARGIAGAKIQKAPSVCDGFQGRETKAGPQSPRGKAQIQKAPSVYDGFGDSQSPTSNAKIRKTPSLFDA